MLNASNRTAFRGMLAFSEGTWNQGDNGYNVIVGSTLEHPSFFDSYADHPRKLVTLRPGLASTAAGRYQLLGHYFDDYKKLLGLSDFSPLSQDIIATKQIAESHALDDVDAGRFDMAVAKCAHIWASLPGAGYGQHENKLDELRAEFARLGGSLT